MSEISESKVKERFPIGTRVLFKGKDIGIVIDYKHANEDGELEVVYRPNNHETAIHKTGMFGIRSQNFKPGKQNV